MADTEKVRGGYRGDNTVTYNVLLPGWYATAIITGETDPVQTSLGLTGYNSANPPVPRDLVQRYIWLAGNTSGLRRKIHVGNASVSFWTTLGWTITLPKQNGTTELFTAVARIGEKILRTQIFAA